MNPYASTSTALDGNVDGSNTLELRGVDPMSAGKVLGAFYGTLGLIFGGLYGLIMVVGGIAGSAAGESGTLMLIPFGLVMVVVFPLLYGGMGAVAGAIMALIYGFVAGRVGGLKLDVVTLT